MQAEPEKRAKIAQEYASVANKYTELLSAEPAKRGRGRPRKNPLPVAVPEPKPAAQDEVTAIGIKECPNSRWVYADLNGTRIQVKVLKSRKSPKNQKFRCRLIAGIQYEEIR